MQRLTSILSKSEPSGVPVSNDEQFRRREIYMHFRSFFVHYVPQICLNATCGFDSHARKRTPSSRSGPAGSIVFIKPIVMTILMIINSLPRFYKFRPASTALSHGSAFLFGLVFFSHHWTHQASVQHVHHQTHKNTSLLRHTRSSLPHNCAQLRSPTTSLTQSRPCGPSAPNEEGRRKRVERNATLNTKWQVKVDSYPFFHPLLQATQSLVSFVAFSCFFFILVFLRGPYSRMNSAWSPCCECDADQSVLWCQLVISLTHGHRGIDGWFISGPI